MLLRALPLHPWPTVVRTLFFKPVAAQGFGLTSSGSFGGDNPSTKIRSRTSPALVPKFWPGLACSHVRFCLAHCVSQLFVPPLVCSDDAWHKKQPNQTVGLRRSFPHNFASESTCRCPCESLCFLPLYKICSWSAAGPSTATAVRVLFPFPFLFLCCVCFQCAL